MSVLKMPLMKRISLFWDVRVKGPTHEAMSLLGVYDQQMKPISLFWDVRLKGPSNEANIVVLAACPKDQPMKLIWLFLGLSNSWSECTETCQKHSVTVIFYYIFHIKPQFLKALFQGQVLFFGSTDFKCSWFKHKLKLFVFKCTIIVLYFWRSKFNFVFKSRTHKNYRL